MRRSAPTLFRRTTLDVGAVEFETALGLVDVGGVYDAGDEKADEDSSDKGEPGGKLVRTDDSAPSVSNRLTVLFWGEKTSEWLQ